MRGHWVRGVNRAQLNCCVKGEDCAPKKLLICHLGLRMPPGSLWKGPEGDVNTNVGGHVVSCNHLGSECRSLTIPHLLLQPWGAGFILES